MNISEQIMNKDVTDNELKWIARANYRRPTDNRQRAIDILEQLRDLDTEGRIALVQAALTMAERRR